MTGPTGRLLLCITRRSHPQLRAWLGGGGAERSALLDGRLRPGLEAEAVAEGRVIGRMCRLSATLTADFGPGLEAVVMGRAAGRGACSFAELRFLSH